MKQLIIACAAIAIATFAQAASVSWTISNVYSPSDSTAKVAAGSVSAWLFVTANTTDVSGIPITTLAAVQSVLDSGDLTGLSSLAAAHGKNYFLASGGAEKTATFTSATGAKALAFGSQATITQAAGGWAAVPEPTSGLLLLLGMAGLALKRKVA